MAGFDGAVGAAGVDGAVGAAGVSSFEGALLMGFFCSQPVKVNELSSATQVDSTTPFVRRHGRGAGRYLEIMRLKWVGPAADAFGVFKEAIKITE